MNNWKNNLIFVSAQPDIPYFHWQCEIYLNNFLDLGIPRDNIHVLFGTQENQKLSSDAKKLKKYTKNIFGFEDARDKKHYIPSIKPYLIYKWLHQKKQRGNLFFVHDSDIIFNSIPDFDSLIQDDVNYVSDCRGYLNYNYLRSCDNKYYEKHSTKIYNGQLIREMCDIIGVEPRTIRDQNDNTGGAQYLLKDQDWQLWYKIYKNSNLLFDRVKRFDNEFPIENGQLQIWTAEMWSILWNQWFMEKKVRISDELSFCWASDKITDCDNKKIFHLAGIVEEMRLNTFYKGDFINVNPLNILKNNPDFFSFIDKTSATNLYVEWMKLVSKKLI